MNIYTILKGWHYSNFIPRIYKRKERISLERYVCFDKSCEYSIREKSCVNKLFGFTHGLFAVHKNSDRFGWTYNDTDLFCLWAYSYSYGSLKKKKIVTGIHPDSTIKLRIESTNEFYHRTTTFYVDDCKYYEIVGGWKHWHSTLGFYFGGVTAAPHKMKIKIWEK